MANTRVWSEQSIIDWLQRQNKEITSGMFRDLIEEHGENHQRMKDLYKEYTGDGVEILSKKSIVGRPNNKIPNDFRGEIVDQKVGFSWGNPVSYTIDKEKRSDADAEKFQDFLKINSIANLDARTASRGAICGTASRLLYTDKSKVHRVINVEPWEVIYIYDQSLTDSVVYALRYWNMERVSTEGVRTNFIRVEWYDETTVHYFTQGDDGLFEPDDAKKQEPHGFKKVPLVEFPNKEDRLSDFEKVGKLIDAYDLIISFNVDELEAFRNAYLIFTGDVEIDDQFITDMKQAGGTSLPDGAEAKFLTKDVNDQFVENMLNRLEENIYRFSKTVNMSDEKFSGDSQSGESRKWKLKSLSDDALIKERYFETSARNMFSVLEDLWNLAGIKIEAMDIDAQFTQNLPLDLLYHAETTGKLKGNVSERTRLSLLPFVEDPDKELEAIDKEAEAILEMGETIKNVNNPTSE